MSSELEKQFFQCFGIEAKEKVNQTFNGADFKVETTKEYPQITDRILLGLMELLMKQQATEFYYHDDVYLFSSKLLSSCRPTCNKANNLRELILRTATCLGGFTPLKNEMLPQVQALFEGEAGK